MNTINRTLQLLIITLALSLMSSKLIAGVNTSCSAIASGNWSNATTWNCNTLSGLPESDTNVDIEGPHMVRLDVDVTVDSIDLDTGSGIIVDSSISETIINWSDNLRFNSGDLVLEGDLTLNALNANSSMQLGVVNGPHFLSVNMDDAVEIQQEIGGTTPLTALVFNGNGTKILAANISTTDQQIYHGKVELTTSVTLTASEVLFYQNVFSGINLAPGYDLTIDGNAIFNQNIGGVSFRNQSTDRAVLGSELNINNLSISGQTTVNNPVASITTDGTQQYSGGLNLNTDLTLFSINGGNISINGSGGAHALTVNTTGGNFFNGVIGNPRHTVITTVGGGPVALRGGTIEFRLESAADTVFNGNLIIGPSGTVIVDQSGTGNIVFNDDIISTSGGGKYLTVNDISGQTIFNGDVNVGRLTTNDGAGDDETVINTANIITDQGGSNNGVMTFNDPVRVMMNTTFSEVDLGQIIFNNTLDAGAGLTSIEVNIVSDNEVIFGAVGTNQSFSSFITDVGGSSTLNGDLDINTNLVFNDDVLLKETILISAESILFNTTVDLQNRDLTLNAFDAIANGVITGSGNLISSVDEDLSLNADNTYTGQTLITSGTLNLTAAPSNNNISVSSEINLGSGTELLPQTAVGLFSVKDGQVFSGEGTVNEVLVIEPGASIRPGSSPGTLTGDDLMMFTGSEYIAEINGTNSGVDSDLLSFNAVDLDNDALGGATLSIITNASLTVGDQIMIVENTGLVPINGTFGGLVEGAVVGSQGFAQYTISYVAGDGNDVVLSVVDLCSSTTFVTNNADIGPGTLREAVDELCDGGEIFFSADMNVVLNSEILVDKKVDINSNGFQVTLSGNNSNRLFNIPATGDLSLYSFNITNGYSTDSGGAILNDGRLFVSDSTFSDNTSDHPSAAGGAVYTVSGGLSVFFESTFINNNGAIGGALYLESGAFPSSVVAVNSTFTQNGLNGLQGGAVYNGGDLQSTNNTFAANGGLNTAGGSLYTNNGGITLYNTLVADGIGGDDCFINLSNSTQNNTTSLIETGNCDATLTDDPELRPVTNNGGNTLTLVPELTSPVIDAGSAASCPDADQLGVARPQFGVCDIGAIETRYLALIHVATNPLNPGGSCVLGTCWENPFTNLQEALVFTGEGSEIWIQEGLYLPDVGANQTDDDQTSSFIIPSGVSMYGGFAGDETEREQRDFNNRVTILSGDIDENDDNNDNNSIAEDDSDINGSNAFNIMVSQGDLILDGITITAGNAIGNNNNELTGGGIRCDEGDNLRIFQNGQWSGNRGVNGGAIGECDAQISHSSFIGNRAFDFGAAIYAPNGLVVHNSSFTFNDSSDDGGAIFGDDIQIDRGYFTGNEADNGGAIAANTIVISNSVLLANEALEFGGALYLTGQSNLTNVTITGNVANRDFGGGIYDLSDDGSGNGLLTINNSIIWNNRDDTGTGNLSATLNSVNPAQINHSLIQASGGSSNWNPDTGIDGGGNIDSDPNFIMDVDLDFVPFLVTGDARLMATSPAIDAGDDTLVVGSLDLEGNDRIMLSSVDMGAYETLLLDYTISGVVNGLAVENTLTLQNNGSDDLMISANGGFTFPTSLIDGSDYAVLVTAQPASPSQTCTVSNGTGTLNGANVTNITVDCMIDTRTIGGQVTGLAAGNSVTLQNNGGDDLVVSGNGSFTFATPLADAGFYDVTVATQPDTPEQTCVVSNGSGVVMGTNITSVNVDCTVNEYMVGGDLNGLAAGNAVTLQNNGSDVLTLKGDGVFVFNTTLADESTYDVTVQNQPTTPNQFCTVANGSGVIAGDDVVDVGVNCVTVQYSVGGELIGLLPGNELVIRNNGSDEITLTVDGLFVFPTQLDDGAPYSVAVQVEPQSPLQNCEVFFSTGSIQGDDVTDVVILCDNNDLIFRNGFDD